MTALQELKNTVNEMINNGGDADLFPLISHIDSLLEKEKNQIINAILDYDSEATIQYANDYFKKMYE